MSKTKTISSRRRKELSYEEFMARHENDRSAVDFLSLRDDGGTATLAGVLIPPPPLPFPMAELKSHAFFRLLSAAARENSPEAYGTHLYLWLCRMGVKPPAGVF